MHDRLHDFEQIVAIQPIDDLQQHAYSCLRTRPAPVRDANASGRELRIEIGLEIADAERLLVVGGDLFADPGRATGVGKVERLPEPRPPGHFASGPRTLVIRVAAGLVRERAPGSPVPAGARCTGESVLMQCKEALAGRRCWLSDLH